MPPVFLVARYLLSRMLLVPPGMPEITIDEYGYSLPCQCYIGLPREFAIVLAIPEACVIQCLAEAHFRPGVLASVAGHGFVTLVPSEHIQSRHLPSYFCNIILPESEFHGSILPSNATLRSKDIIKDRLRYSIILFLFI